jgi:hypothetical protein
MALQPFVEPRPLFSFLIIVHLVGLLARGISQSQGRYLHTEQHKQTSMLQVGSERTIPVFELADTVHDLVRAVTVIGDKCVYPLHFLEILLQHPILYVYDFSTAIHFCLSYQY